MKMRKIMACLDVGSDTVKCVVGEMVKRKLNILAVAEVPSKGVKHGIVEDPSSLLDPLKSVIQKCEESINSLCIFCSFFAVSLNRAHFLISIAGIPT